QDSKNPRAYLYKGLAYAYYTDRKNQELAAENIKKAIDLGLKDSQYYSILGVVFMNLGRLESARELFKEAVRLDENNTQAKEFLNKYFPTTNY
ncbi:MAG: tetratricopeptide repeat protein, partial [Nanoarchaeota archaeon]